MTIFIWAVVIFNVALFLFSVHGLSQAKNLDLAEWLIAVFLVCVALIFIAWGLLCLNGAQIPTQLSPSARQVPVTG